MKADAAVLRSAGDSFQLEGVHLDEPGCGEILVRIAGTGICHTDLLGRAGLLGVPLPAVLGHEGAGVVEAVGEGVNAVSVGDHVVLSYGSCGTCVSCHRGQPFHCATFFLLNALGCRPDGTSPMVDSSGNRISARWFCQSSFASHAIATERNVVRVDRSLPLELLGPLGCGIQTGAGAVLNSLAARAGSSIAVFGVGAVGLAAVMAANVAGCAKIIALDLVAERLGIAKDLGATHTVNGSSADAEAELLDIASGGLDFGLDTTGNPSVIGMAVGSLRSGGVCGLVAGAMDAVFSFPAPALLIGRTIMGILEGSATPQVFVPQLIELWQQGRFPFDRLIRTYPLSAINEAIGAAERGDVIKPVVMPG